MLTGSTIQAGSRMPESARTIRVDLAVGVTFADDVRAGWPGRGGSRRRPVSR